MMDGNNKLTSEIIDSALDSLTDQAGYADDNTMRDVNLALKDALMKSQVWHEYTLYSISTTPKRVAEQLGGSSEMETAAMIAAAFMVQGFIAGAIAMRQAYEAEKLNQMYNQPQGSTENNGNQSH
jgi:hypothetical protein